MSKNVSKKTDKSNKPVKRPHEYSPVIGDNGLTLDKGDNTRFLQFNMELSSMPAIDVLDDSQVEQRIRDYFALNAAYDLKPTVTGLGLALGLDRRRLWEVANDVEGRNVRLGMSARDSIKKAYLNLEILWEHYMLNGKINPVTGIFMGKNNFGYKDQSEMVLTPNNPLGNQLNAEDISQYRKQIVGNISDDD